MAVLDEHTVHGHWRPVVWVHRRARRKTMSMSMTTQPEIMPSSGRSAATANAIRCTGPRWALQVVRNLAGGRRRRVLLVLLLLGRTLERRHAGLRPDRRQVGVQLVDGGQRLPRPRVWVRRATYRCRRRRMRRRMRRMRRKVG